MTSRSQLTPSIAAERLFPRNAAFMARTDLEQTRLMVFEPWNLESITNIFLGLMNGLATVRHRAGVTDEILALFERSGVPVAEDLRVYDRCEEAERFADELVAEGRKLVFLYPLRANRFPSSGYLVTPELWARLNSKATLAELVPAAHLAPRQIHSVQELEGRGFERPVYLKDASLEASGGGCAIRACLDAAAWTRALEELRRIGARRFVVEEALPVERCWCVALVIEPDQTRYAGAAEQVFGTPGQQTGSMIDPEHPLPAEGVRLAVEVGERARRAGFVGVAGLDIGITADRRLFVFDPNFRINSSSSQSLLHDAATRRAGYSTSYSTHVTTSLPFAEVARRLAGPIDDGWFIPTRCLDAAWLPGRGVNSVCDGFVLAADRASAIAAAERLSALLSG